MLDIEKAIEEAKERCLGTGHRRHLCSQCATGDGAWKVWSDFVISRLRAAGTDPSEVLDHTGRVSAERKRSIDDILKNEFGGHATVRNINAAAATHVQRTKEAAGAQRLANEAAIAARLLAADRRLAARFQKEADLAAAKTLTARIKRILQPLLRAKRPRQ
jgi:hypothetical protein